MEYLLTTAGLTKQYGRHKAVNNVGLHVRQGDIYGLIGRNGAGKTTVLKMLSGLSTPTSGSFTLFGASGRKAAPYMSRIGTLIEAPGAYIRICPPVKNLKLKCLALGVRKKGEVEELLQIVGLSDAAERKSSISPSV